MSLTPLGAEPAPRHCSHRRPQENGVADLDDIELVAALQAGDEDMFRRLVTHYQPALIRAARAHVRSSASAEEVAQETWLAVVRGIGAFEARASFKTWLFRILVNQAMTRGKQEARFTPQSTQGDDLGSSHSAASFDGTGYRSHDRWRAVSSDWGRRPEALVQSSETVREIALAIASLPPLQSRVMSMRDSTGLTTIEVCGLLKISEANQRVLLHRARSRVRKMLEARFEMKVAA